MTIYTGASGNFILPSLQKKYYYGKLPSVCVCVRKIESSLKVPKSCQQAHPAADLTVYGCGSHPVVYLVSILFLSPCPQTPPPPSPRYFFVVVFLDGVMLR